MRTSQRPIALAGLLAVTIIVGVIAAAYVTRLYRLEDIELGPDPIPIPESACPALSEVRAAAASAAQGWPEAVTQNYAGEEWRQFADQLAPKLERFAATLRAAPSNVPAPVAEELGDVLPYVEIGQRHLDAPDAATYMQRTKYALFSGTIALGRASDLVGKACGDSLMPETAALVDGTR